MKALLLLVGLALALTNSAWSQLSTDILDNSVVWRYSDKGTLPPLQSGRPWYDPLYNDTEAAAGAMWDSGVGPFGYGDSVNYGANDYSSTAGAAAALHYGSDANNKFITTYFRAKFFLPADIDIGPTADQFNTLVFRTRVDDGFVVYLNGVEVQRYNLPTGQGAVVHSTVALGAIEALWRVYSIPVDFPDLVLNTGATANVIAVEIHQASATSSDIIFEQQLTLQSVAACEGLARPGIQERFDSALDNGHFRPELNQTIPLELQDTDMQWSILEVVPISAPHNVKSTSIRGPEFGTPLPNGNAFQFTGGRVLWESEVVDVRGYKDIQFRARIQHMANVGATYGASDSLSFRIMGSQDGVFFQPKVWWSTKGDIAWTQIFAETQPKKALVPTAANTPDNTSGANNWRTLNFNDAAWKSGTGGVGYDTDTTSAQSYIPVIGAGLDVKTEMNTKNTACYVRVKFSVTNPSQYTRMRLRMKYDDGFVAYLNGVKIAEAGYQPTTGGLTYPPPFNAKAVADYGEANALQWKDFEVTDATTLANALASLSATANGNILAIYGLNVNLTSSDFLCIPALDLGVGDPPAMQAATLDDGSQSTYVTITSPVGSTKLVPPGTHFVKIQMESELTNTKQLALDDVAVLGTPVEAVSFYSAMKVKFPTLPDAQILAEADVDGDSLANIAEYGTGTDPAIAALRADNPNGLPQQFTPIVTFLPDKKVEVKFRVPATSDLIQPDPANDRFGYTVGDLNIRPQLSRGHIGNDGAVEWADGVVGVNEFLPVGQPQEVEDGTNSQWVTMRTVSPVANGESQIYVRLRYGVIRPYYLKDGAQCQ